MGKEITIEGLAADVAALSKKNESLTEQLSELSQQNQDLKKVVEAASTSGSKSSFKKKKAEVKKLLIPDTTVKVGKKEYKVAFPQATIAGTGTDYDGKTFSAEEVLADDKLCKVLVELKSSFLVEVFN